MRKAIALTFTAAALLMLASVAFGIYGRGVFEGREAAGEPSKFSVIECYDCGVMEPWEKTAGLAGLLAVATSIAGAMLLQTETRPHRVSMLGLDAGAPRRVARAHTSRAHDDEGLTPLERVLRGY